VGPAPVPAAVAAEGPAGPVLRSVRVEGRKGKLGVNFGEAGASWPIGARPSLLPRLGFARIVALCDRSSTLYEIREQNSKATMRPKPTPAAPHRGRARVVPDRS
jgi:hypothetical protein